MRSETALCLFSGVGVLSSLCFAETSRAQVPHVSAEAVATAGMTEQGVAQPQLVASSSEAPGNSDVGAEGAFMQRYKPVAGLSEIGAFIGPVFISDRNSFRSSATVNPGAPPTVMPYSTYQKPSVELGVRGAYFPFSFLGGELEGALGAAETDRGDGVVLLAGRAQVVVQAPYWSVVPFVVGGAGFWYLGNDYSGGDVDPAFHFGGGAKVNVSSQVAVRFDIRDTLTNRRELSAAPNNIEALLGGSLVLGRKSPAPQDSDRDGFTDDRDVCPLEAGTLPNGCPVRDTDGDGVLDPADQCVSEPGVAPTGCPILDADQDGVLDTADQCVSEKGVMPTGCPDADLDGIVDRNDKCPAVPGVAPDGCLPDADHDGILGADDRCPDQAETRNGFEDADGCPDELPAAVKSFMGVIAGIEFDTNKDTIRDSSAGVLDRAFAVLRDYPSLSVEIIGHTDDRGTHEHNQDLSQRRADSVKNHLVARGIDPRRIRPRGAGPDEPLVANTSLVGRQKNRRIEFRVIE
jgi:outer membrane protein OmpA-like peptidoglycan-associated protein